MVAILVAALTLAAAMAGILTLAPPSGAKDQVGFEA
jgi:hypothetical protein